MAAWTLLYFNFQSLSTPIRLESSPGSFLFIYFTISRCGCN